LTFVIHPDLSSNNRQAFLDKIPVDWSSCSGLLTNDGEHPNEAGSVVEASALASILNLWMQEA
jgi:hypothetical protein